MPDVTYPKIKYQPADPAPVPYNADKPGFTYQKVNSADEEKALEGTWFDTPAEAIKANKPAPKDAAAAQTAQSGTRTEDWPTESDKARKK